MGDDNMGYDLIIYVSKLGNLSLSLDSHSCFMYNGVHDCDSTIPFN